jgi:hypothetical protein
LWVPTKLVQNLFRGKVTLWIHPILHLGARTLKVQLTAGPTSESLSRCEHIGLLTIQMRPGIKLRSLSFGQFFFNCLPSIKRRFELRTWPRQRFKFHNMNS